ncbi:protein Lines homolog 1 [Erinaceus europaeus]|uniref:Protein Lines homolog 1 n=1 Tax=Erinaceus europaeus TaxID=9365 RepID=A0A1S3A4H2_ERIEU|nr:protein Lines homolog 1 [Erinaceus europaeus]XP_060035288.1 protein Lines homolog 1 [Erinaceus europaeus]XP_060035289.1 protein Lines homolog 1 [Erinaceus europaeus]
MKAVFEALEQLYKKVLFGAPLDRDSHDYISHLNPTLAEQDCSEAASSECSDLQGAQDTPQLPAVNVCLKRSTQMSSARELTLLQLTVMRVMITRILSLETESPAKEQYRHMILILLKSSEVDLKLICMFQDSDKLLSHMAAKCLALLLYFQLKEKMTLSNSWIAFCHKSLSEYSGSDKVAHCLWTLTVVVKEIFKDTSSQKAEILKQFLAPFDTVLEEFYSSFFSQQFEKLQDASKTINSLTCFLELLELLIASRIHLKLHFTCQRLLFLKPSCVLRVITWPVQAFVKRKCIIFIKKCLLWKVGEDLCGGSLPAFVPPDPHLDGDMLALANAVLQSVDLGLLRTLSVHGKRSYFGGDVIQPGCEPAPGPDHVILRAASLLILKSLEIKFQHCTSANEMKVDLQRFMSELLTFVKPHLQPSLTSHNPCEWLSKVFIEQDDDMLEAANVSLGIYRKVTRDYKTTESLAQGERTWNQHTHENGYNPHCIFLFFLRNIGFDSTVLLDFLISSETCFLEYFVKYLKLLQKDWDNYFTICKSFAVTESKDSLTICSCSHSLSQDKSHNQKEPGHLAPLRNHRNAHTQVPEAAESSPEPLSPAVMAKETQTTLQTKDLDSSKAPWSLVDYDSSEDSEVESPDQYLASSKQISFHQEAMMKIQATDKKNEIKKECSLEPPSRILVPKELTAPFSVDCDTASTSIIYEVGISHRTVKCFQELQGAVSRLQKKNLFPYNPTALLKLLKHIEAIYNKDMNPL